MSQQLELLSECPSKWTTVMHVTPEIQKKEIKPFVILSLKQLEGTEDPRTRSLQHADKFAAIHAVIRHFTRLQSGTKRMWDVGDVTAFLEGLRFSPECTTELATLLCTEQLYSNIPKHMRVKPGVVSLQWKIDLSMSQSKLQSENAYSDVQRSKEIMHQSTHIIITFTLTNEEVRTYRISLAAFHELRYAIASALKTMIVQERRKCMRD